MRGNWLGLAVAVWGAVTFMGAVAVATAVRSPPPPEPAGAVRQWLDAAESAMMRRRPLPPAIPQVRAYRAPQGFVVLWWCNGRVRARVDEAHADLVEVWRRMQQLTGVRGQGGEVKPCWQNEAFKSYAVGQAVPLMLRPRWLAAVSVVPLRDGVLSQSRSARVALVPEEMQANGIYSTGIATPIPDLHLGIDWLGVLELLATAGAEAPSSRSTGESRHYARATVRRLNPGRRAQLPKDSTQRAAALEDSAYASAAYLIRQQRSNGSFQYLVQPFGGRRERARSSPGRYSLARHAGTAYFLAEFGRSGPDHAALSAARQALAWLRRYAWTDIDSRRAAIGKAANVATGASALAVIAAAEAHAAEVDPSLRQMVRSLCTFLLGQLRRDGSVAPFLAVEDSRPFGEPKLYVEGQVALALARAAAVLDEPRYSQAAVRVLEAIAERWRFFGARYYFGEEHWTCMAAVSVATSGLASNSALELCRLWGEYNRGMQFRSGETPWPVEGAYGVGPVVLPLLNPAATRSEAMISLVELDLHRGRAPDRQLIAQVERGLEALLRAHLDPGPRHLLRSPSRFRGGMPFSLANLTVRIDSAQHAGSAWLRWAHVLTQLDESPSL